jgi:hypothetical protein
VVLAEAEEGAGVLMALGSRSNALQLEQVKSMDDQHEKRFVQN